MKRDYCSIEQDGYYGAYTSFSQQAIRYLRFKTNTDNFTIHANGSWRRFR